MKEPIISDDNPKESLRRELAECAKAMGGKNYFLQLLEAIREVKPHPIINKQCEFRYPLGSIKWEKAIFRDKLTLLIHTIRTSKTGNIYPKEGTKGYKSALNLLRTLNPIVFNVNPKNKKDGPGFKLHAFDIIDERTTVINPTFEAVLFKPIYHVKRIINAK